MSGYDWGSVYFDGTYIHVAYSSCGNNAPVYYRKGLPGGDGVIDWSSEQTALAAVSGTYYRNPSVAVDGSGYPWIGYGNRTSSYDRPYVTRSNTTDGTWNTDVVFPHMMESVSTVYNYPTVLPLSEGRVYILWYHSALTVYGQLWDGNFSETSPVNVLSNSIRSEKSYSALVDGGSIHIAYLDTGSALRYQCWNGTAWSTSTIVQSGVYNINVYPSISIDDATGNLYVFWAGSPAENHVYYKRWTGSWDASPTDISDGSPPALKAYYQISSSARSYGSVIGLALVTNSPENVRYQYLSLAGCDSPLVNSLGSPVNLFSNSFYNSLPSGDIHNLLSARAELQNGTGTQAMETYYKYSGSGLLEESRSLLNGGWLTSTYRYDGYGNLVEAVDPEGRVTYYDYGSAYGSAYVTAVKRLLVAGTESNVTVSYGYDLPTGRLTSSTDQRGNTTNYEYDALGRVRKIIYPSIDGYRAEEEAIYNLTAFTSAQSAALTNTGSAGASSSTSWQRTSSFEAEGCSWVFYYDGGNICYRSRAGSGSWSACDSSLGAYSQFDIFFDGTYVHAAFSSGTSGGDLFYRRGNPKSDGTIIWETTAAARVVGAGYYIYRPQIAVTERYVWIAYFGGTTTSDQDPYVARSSNMAGGWTSVADTKIDNCNNLAVIKATPLTDDKLYVAWTKYAAPNYVLYGMLFKPSSQSVETIDSSIPSTMTPSFDVVS